MGQPRSGTTSLYRYLRQHPDIYMADEKEPFYFCTDFHEESDRRGKRRVHFPFRNEEQYLGLFRKADGEIIIGEATSEYLYSKNAAENIYAFNPDSKILILLRNPVDFLYSLHSKLLTFGIENISDFHTALAMEPERKKGRFLPKNNWPPSSLYYSERVKYPEQISRYLDHFSEEQVKIIIFEEFLSDQLRTFKSITKFLETDTGFSPDFDIFNPNRALRSAFMNKVFEWCGNLPIKNFFPALFWKKLAKKIRKLNTTQKPRAPLANDVRAKLMRQTRNEVCEISRSLNRDLLKLWGYPRENAIRRRYDGHGSNWTS